LKNDTIQSIVNLITNKGETVKGFYETVKEFYETVKEFYGERME